MKRVRALCSDTPVTISLSYILLIKDWKCRQSSWVAGRCSYRWGLQCTENFLCKIQHVGQLRWRQECGFIVGEKICPLETGIRVKSWKYFTYFKCFQICWQHCNAPVDPRFTNTAVLYSEGFCCSFMHPLVLEKKYKQINLLMPNDPYSGRTAPPTSKRCILYIYSTNIRIEYFKDSIYSPFFPLQNAVCFIILTYLVPVLFTFYIQGVLKLKK